MITTSACSAASAAASMMSSSATATQVRPGRSTLPIHVTRLRLGSVSKQAIVCPARRHQSARHTARVVLPGPPLVLAMDRIGMLVLCRVGMFDRLNVLAWRCQPQSIGRVGCSPVLCNKQLVLLSCLLMVIQWFAYFLENTLCQTGHSGR